MIEDVLNSGIKVKIMKYLSKFPDSQFQAIRIAKALNLSVSRTSECLNDLAGKGVLESKKVGKGHIFKLNKSNYLARIISEMFEKERNFANIVALDFASKAKKMRGVESIVLFGSALQELNTGSDIDIMIVSDKEIDRSAISEISAELAGKYGFPVSVISMTTRELKRKLGEAFVINIIASGKVIFGKSLEEIVYGKGRQKG